MQTATILERSRGVLLAQWDELLRLRREVLKTSELEAIHDLRVTSRRFRAAVGLFNPWIPAKSAALLKKRIRKLTRLLGGLRNLDEALLFFRLRTPAESGGGYQICRILSAMRPVELARIEKALTAFDLHSLNRTVRKAAARLKEERIADSGNSSLPVYFSDTCIRLYQPIHDLLPGATSREHRESRHALRIAIKKWRYFFEIVAPVLGHDYSSTVGLLKEYQTILGCMNDVAVFGALCGRLALSRHERGFVETILQAEDALLLQKLTELIEQKPLTYTFLL
ncbi:MAG: CHAD domain-containing protein [Desulfuromonadaceae bacterium]